MKTIITTITGILMAIATTAYGQNSAAIQDADWYKSISQMDREKYDPQIISPKNYDEWIENGWRDCGEIQGYTSTGHKTKVHMFYKNKTFMAVYGNQRGEVRVLPADEQYPFKYTDYPIKHTKFTREAPMKTDWVLWQYVYFK